VADSRENYDRDKFARKLAGKFLPIPKIITIAKVPENNNYYCISKYIPGNYIEDLESPQITELTPQILQLLVKLRDVDIEQTNGYGPFNSDGAGSFKTWKDFLLDIDRDDANHTISGWSKELKKSENGSHLFMEGFKSMKSLVKFCPDSRHLIHSDLLHFNLLVKDNKISAVLDWGCGKFGDFLYDLAWFTFWGDFHDNMRHINFKKEAQRYFRQEGIKVAEFEKRLLCYEMHVALDSLAYTAWAGNWDDLDEVCIRLDKRL
jgi:hygromycin-B 4-O-kinase